MKPRIFLACEADESETLYSRKDFERLQYYALKDSNDQFLVTDNSNEADLIIFVGSSQANFSDVRNSTLYKKHYRKSVLYYSGDRLIPLIPGLYPCLEKSMARKDSQSCQSSYYMRVTDNDSLEIKSPIEQADLLYSFKGNSKNHSVRNKLLKLNHPKAFLADTALSNRKQTDSNNLDYLDLIKRSKFVLCPRGIGTSSWRLFETMRAGRVPVIISDQWVETPGPNWQACSIRIKESETHRINEILLEREAQAKSLADNARKEWLKYYSEENLFNTIVNQAIESLKASKNTSPKKISLYLNYFKPYFFRHWLITTVKRKVLG